MRAATPTPPQQRLEALDALRGFALLGVLVVNVYQSYGLRLSPLDSAVGRWIALLGEGSFYPAFSLLFGLGFALQLGRGTPTARFRRRLFWLLAFGLVHGVFIWHGDILASYALIGLLLPYLARASSRDLLLLAGLLYGLSFLLFAALATGPDVTPSPGDIARAPSYLAALELRAERFTAGLLSGVILFGGQLLALFALGLYLGRQGVARLLAERRWLSRALVLCLLVAVPILWLYARTPEAPRLLYALEYLVASPLLGFAYLAALALILQIRPRPALAAVGRMALSNYLAQSVLCTLLYYAYGLGLYGRLGVAANLLLSLGVFAAQMLFSRLWLRHFRFGPAEWLWRSLTYGQAQPWLRKTARPSPE